MSIFIKCIDVGFCAGKKQSGAGGMLHRSERKSSLIFFVGCLTGGLQKHYRFVNIRFMEEEETEGRKYEERERERGSGSLVEGVEEKKSKKVKLVKPWLREGAD